MKRTFLIAVVAGTLSLANSPLFAGNPAGTIPGRNPMFAPNGVVNGNGRLGQPNPGNRFAQTAADVGPQG